MSTDKIRVALDALTEVWRERTGHRDGVPTEVHEALLEVEEIERRGTKPKYWPCRRCHKQFATKSHLMRHISTCDTPALLEGKQ